LPLISAPQDVRTIVIDGYASAYEGRPKKLARLEAFRQPARSEAAITPVAAADTPEPA
jgi:hypothetical protein